MLGTQAYRMSPRVADGHWDSAIIGAVLVLLLAISSASLVASQVLKPGAPATAPWCAPGQLPRFEFGFNALAQQIGSTMGAPIDCEHGDDSSENTLQTTTTGLAVYDWCTNTPGFSSGQEHWVLTPQGVMHWTGDAGAPGPFPVVRAPDLRHLCLT